MCAMVFAYLRYLSKILNNRGVKWKEKKSSCFFQAFPLLLVWLSLSLSLWEIFFALPRKLPAKKKRKSVREASKSKARGPRLCSGIKAFFSWPYSYLAAAFYTRFFSFFSPSRNSLCLSEVLWRETLAEKTTKRQQQLVFSHSFLEQRKTPGDTFMKT